MTNIMRHLTRNVAAPVHAAAETLSLDYRGARSNFPTTVSGRSFLPRSPRSHDLDVFTFARNDCHKHESCVMRKREREREREGGDRKRPRYAIKSTVLVSATSVPDASFAAWFMTRHKYVSKSVPIVTMDIRACMRFL